MRFNGPADMVNHLVVIKGLADGLYEPDGVLTPNMYLLDVAHACGWLIDAYDGPWGPSFDTEDLDRIKRNWHNAGEAVFDYLLGYAEMGDVFEGFDIFKAHVN